MFSYSSNDCCRMSHYMSIACTHNTDLFALRLLIKHLTYHRVYSACSAPGQDTPQSVLCTQCPRTGHTTECALPAVPPGQDTPQSVLWWESFRRWPRTSLTNLIDSTREERGLAIAMSPVGVACLMPSTVAGQLLLWLLLELDRPVGPSNIDI